MLAAVLVANVGLMWVAIEATTIVSALLIPLRVTKASVEASWKYILIGSVGIALAFVGTVLAYFDFVGHSGAAADALNWPVLMVAAPHLPPDVMRLAFVFLLVGYGTKAGLAPMHTWLPDAHSEAPAPLSAMMSGVLLAVAMYAIMRWKAVADLAVGPAFTNALLIALGLLSLAIAGFSLVGQRNYKRLLAYSSVEHTGLTCLGLALGPLGAFAALLASPQPQPREVRDVPAERPPARAVRVHRHVRHQGTAQDDAPHWRPVRRGRPGARRPAAVRPVHLGICAAASRVRRGEAGR